MIPLSFIALVLGLTYESYTLCHKWREVGYNLLIAAIITSIILVLFISTETNFTDQILWLTTTTFAFFYISIATIKFIDKAVPFLTEGITLLQSLALVYWAIDSGFEDLEDLSMILLYFLGAFFVLFSVVHAFTTAQLSNFNRFILSIGSSVIMLFFAITNIESTIASTPQNQYTDITTVSNIFIQYFLLGVGSMYIATTFIMLWAFFPNTDINKKDRGELVDMHLNRFSGKQLNINDALMALAIGGITFLTNGFYHLLPRLTAIWLVFVTVPIAIGFFKNSQRQGITD